MSVGAHTLAPNGAGFLREFGVIKARIGGSELFAGRHSLTSKRPGCWHGELRSKTTKNEILLGRERTLCCVEREILEEATVVVINLGLAMSQGIHRHT